MQIKSLVSRFNLGITHQLIGLIAFIAIGVGGSIGLVLNNTSRNALRAEVFGSSLAEADLAAQLTSNYVKQVQISVDIFADRIRLMHTELVNSPEDVEDDLQALLEIQPAIDGSGFYDTNGIQRVNGLGNKQQVGASYADRDWFQGAMRTRKPYLGTAVLSRLTNNPVAVYAVPIFDERGQLLGILSASISLSDLSDTISKIPSEPGAGALLVDFRDNTIMAHPDKTRIMSALDLSRNQAAKLLLAGERGTMETRDENGNVNLTAYAPVPELPWGILVYEPSQIAFAPADELARQANLITGLSIVVAGLLGGLLALRITRPAIRLREASQQLANGDRSFRVNLTQRDEIGDLGRAFDQMADALAENDARLRNYTLELEQEIDERKRAEAALAQSEKKLKALFESAPVGIAVVDADRQMVTHNEELAMIMRTSHEGLLSEASRNRQYLRADGTPMPHEEQASVRAIKEGRPIYNVESGIRLENGEIIWTQVNASPLGLEDGSVVVITQDITARKNAEEELRRSNAELEQFAYVASHDLQEPLRMVASYTQLLARRYRSRLDADADEFIHYAVDGAARMQRLITDLLTYSRVGTQGKKLKPTAADEVVDLALANLQAAIDDSHAIVSRDTLPTILGDDGQFVQLFQNLVGNALKFHGAQAPNVHISAERRDSNWVFAVRDNGIGIHAKYSDRIFVIFQRLHTREEYAGTGIGLAVCKKIVERHGGRIWFESEPGQGTTFFFTIPARDESGGIGSRQTAHTSAG